MAELKNAQLKNNQHYVFQSYLKAWCVDNEVWVYKRGTKIKRRGTKSLLYAYRFYELKDLNEDELKFIELCMIVAKMTDAEKQLMWKHIEDVLLPFENMKVLDALKMKIKNINQNGIMIDEETKDLVQQLDNLIEEMRVNTLEDFHGEYEHSGAKWIERICNGDLSFYYPNYNKSGCFDYEERNEFIQFLCVQYFRTLGMHDILFNNIKNMSDAYKKSPECTFNCDNVNPENVLFHLVWILQSRCASKLMYDNAHMTVLNNKTELPFVTSDQPIINLKFKQDNELMKLVLYYPLTPSVAILLNDHGNSSFIEITDEQEIDNYNRAMAYNYHKYLIGNSESVLKMFAAV